MGYTKFITKFVTPTPNNLVAGIQIRKSFFLPSSKSITSSQTDSCKSFNPVLFASSSERSRVRIPPRVAGAMFLHAQCRSFVCLLMLSADSYIGVRERLQVNDLFMHMLVDIRANNCKSRSDFLVTSRLWRSISGYFFDSYNNSVNAIRHSLIALISTHVCHHHYTFPPCALNKCSSHTLLHVPRSDVL